MFNPNREFKLTSFEGKIYLMMKKTSLLIILFFSTAFAGKGQNLVPNGDFEQYSGCPNGLGDLDSALFWFNPTNASSEYFNQCANFSFPGVPNNVFGYQPSHSGNGYAGLINWGSNFSWHEYIEAPLLSPLTAGTCYHFEMFINEPNNVLFKTDAIGIYFSDTMVIDFTTTTLLQYNPQINNIAGNLPDTINWLLVAGNFIANGGENFLTLGNFENDSSITLVVSNPLANDSFAYIYIDDVSLTLCTAIEEHNNNKSIKIYPNPVKDWLNVQIPNSNFQSNKAEIKITDILGKEMWSKQFSKSKIQIPTSGLKNGIYFIEINNGKNIYRKKFIKN